MTSGLKSKQTRKLMPAVLAGIAAAAAVGATLFYSGLLGQLSLSQGAWAQTSGKTADMKVADAKSTDVPATLATASTPPGPLFQFTQQLQTAGVSKCLNTTQGMGSYAMNGAQTYASTTIWDNKQPDAHQVLAVVGQKFSSTSSTPEIQGVSAILAAPNASGKCDGATVQVIPSPLSCTAVQNGVLAKGKQLGTLAGMPLLQNADNTRIVLIPTAGNGCVVFGFNSVYVE